ncbi:DUF3397 domain-containing protein [Amphibacillus sp. MSJ-3]|uniref:DUF3397 family protein n=1 Tax=Amphibacillus sp. MSJ-3 TaxID=2841505 RepID=UPI001C0F1DD7|nr:DUF3397 family protein [Amphibacillus sp. MSJ-3]MBU5595388.1 DUF3397 domain-containing protein [Amphibacillus sp. MSJ-3]
MSQILAYLIAFSVTFPIVMTLIMYYIIHFFVTNQKKAIHKSMEYTAILYVVSTIFIVYETFNINMLGPLSIFLLVGFLLFIIIQWKLISDIRIRRVWQLYFRFLFLIFFIANMTLVLVSIYLQI